jgi:hypothetical protein
MSVIQSSLKVADYTLTGVGAILLLVMLALWGRAALVWGDAQAYAMALAITMLTILTFSVAHVIAYIRG